MSGKQCGEASTLKKDPKSLVRTSTLYVPKDCRDRESSYGSNQGSSYSIWDLRRALRTVPHSRGQVVLQLWSKLHPDESVKATKPIADMSAYVSYLTRISRSGQLRAPPKIALERRVAARKRRRLTWVVRQTEARKKAQNDAYMANEVRQLRASKGAVCNIRDASNR